MLKKIAVLLGWSCQHTFEVVNKVKLFAPRSRRPVGIEYHMGCSKCGKVRVGKIIK